VKTKVKSFKVTKYDLATAPPDTLVSFLLTGKFSSFARQPLVCQGLLLVEASRSHSDTPHSVGLLLTSDQPYAEPCTWQHTVLTRGRHPCRRRDSNPQFQQGSGGRPTLDRAVTVFGSLDGDVNMNDSLRLTVDENWHPDYHKVLHHIVQPSFSCSSLPSSEE
jgi:hypothetical protein